MSKYPPRAQSIEAKRAESRRPFHGESVLRDSSLSSMHRIRASRVLADLQDLANRGIPFNGPFLEIGAGSVQRSAAVVNHFDVDGVATDISQQSLRDTPHILALLDYSRSPMLVCCDSHHLPFLPDTFRFVLAYQTLHHFENPVPVVAECHRVLGKGGYLFFNEEPVDSPLRRFLRGNRVLSHPPTRLQRLAYRLRVEKVFWDDGALERSLGMTEARFDLGLWRDTLKPFGRIELEVNRRLKLRTDLYRPAIGTALAVLVGGNARGLCLKTDGNAAPDDYRTRLMCLDCGSAQLSRGDARLLCASCGRVYPIEAGVIRMLPRELESQLHPGPSALA